MNNIIVRVDEVFPTPLTTQEQIEAAILHFEQLTTQYIQNRVETYNRTNGLAFANIDAFPKYAINAASVHYTIANQFIIWSANVWEALRMWQSTLTTIPTDAEWQVIVDAVPF